MASRKKQFSSHREMQSFMKVIGVVLLIILGVLVAVLIKTQLGNSQDNRPKASNTGSVTLYFSPATITVKPKTQQIVEVRARSTEPLSAVDLYVISDPSKVTITNIVAGDDLPATLTKFTKNPDHITVGVSCDKDTCYPKSGDSISIAKVVFSAKESTSISFKIHQSNTQRGTQASIITSDINQINTNSLTPLNISIQSLTMSSTTILTATCGNPVYSTACVPKNGTYKLTVSGIQNAQKVLFATWNLTNELDDQKNYWARNMGNTSWQAEVNQANHPGTDKMQSNVWFYDSSGKQTWCTGILLPICE